MRSVISVFVVVLLTGTIIAGAMADNGPMWAGPGAMAVKRVGDIPSAQHRSNAFGNLDCTEITYRLAGHNDMRQGCFVPTAFGMLDPDYDIAIFNGTDEGLPLDNDVPHRVLVPWPKSLNLVTLDAADTGGSYIKIYKNPLAGLKDERDWTGQLAGKLLTTSPDINLTDSGGRPLIINPAAMAFSDGGNWLVTETLSGSFVRINLASLDQSAFAPSFTAAGWPGRLFRSEVAVSGEGRYVAIGNDYAGSLKIYDVGNCSGKVCPSYDYLPFLKQKVGGIKSIRDIRFINDGLISFEADSDNGGGIYELAPTGSINSLTDYMGLGDSYTSGEGAFDYLLGTDTRFNNCHLSANSYPLLLTHDLFSNSGGHSVACSGAMIDDVGSNSDEYHGQASGDYGVDDVLSDFAPGYVAQQRFVRRYQPRTVTVSVGGNDIGFGDILERCVVPHISRHHSDENCYDTYESRQEVVDLVDRTVKRWTSLYQQLKTESPGSTIYVVGYPSIASDIGNCSINVRLDKNELEFAEELIGYMNGSIRGAAMDAGVPYVDIGNSLAGHRLCEASGSSVAVNGLTAGNDFGIFGIGLLGRESYHPNALSHRLIEQAILRQTDNLSAGLHDIGTTEAPSETGNLLDAPKTGRPINTLVQDRITEPRAEPGENVRVRVNGARDGLRPFSRYEIHLDGPSGPSVGSLESDSRDDLSGLVTIPKDMDEDMHVIDVVGAGQNDRPIDVTQSIYVGSLNTTMLEDYGQAKNAPTSPAALDMKTKKDERRGNHGVAADKIVSSGALGVLRSISGTPFFAPMPVKQNPRAVIISAIGGLSATLVMLVRRIIKPFPGYFGKCCNNRRKKNYKKLCQCFTMVIMRTFGVIVFSVILFVGLLVFAFSTSSNSTLTDRHKVEAWLGDSNLYGAFVENAINQADQTTGTDQSGGVSLSDTAVKQAAQQSFSSTVLENDVGVFLNANYAWLKGQTGKPTFRVDLSGAKRDFADKVGAYVTAYLKGLPACTAAQSANINAQTVDPLALQCLPHGLNPKAVGTQVTQQIATSTQFLSSTVITADNINPSSTGLQMKPYYQRFSTLPNLYQLAVKIPWVAAIVSLLSLIAIIWVSYNKRKGIKVVAIIFALAGLVMVLTKLAMDHVFSAVENHIFNSSSVGQLQKALTVFMHHAETQLVRVDLWFGIGYLIVALTLVITLILTRKRGLRIPKPLQNLMPSDNTSEGEDETETPRPKPSPKPRPPKPPRLVQ